MAEEDFIKMQVGESPSPKNNFSRFNGRTFTFGSSVRVGKIVQIRVAKNQTQSRNWERTVNPGTPLNLNEYTENGNVITLVSFAAKIKVIYEKRAETQAEFEARATPEQIKAQQQLIGELTNGFNGQIATSKIQNLIGNFSSLNKSGQTSNGFKCLTSSARPTKDFTKRPMIGELLSGAVDGSGDVTSTQTSALSTLFKSSKITSSPRLTKKVYDQPSANAILNVFKNFTSAPKETIKEVTKKVLPANLSTKVLEQADTTINDTEAGVSLNNKITEKTKAEIKSKQKEIQNAGISLNINGLIPQAGRSSTNIFASALAKVKNIKTSGTGNIFEKIKSLPDGVTTPEGVNLDDILPGINELTGDFNLNTNTNKFISKGGLTPDVGITAVKNLSASTSGFNGYSTARKYKFEYLQSVDEMKTEFENSSRMKTGTNNLILALIIGWTDKFYGPPEKVNATSIHDLTKLSDLQIQIKAKKSQAAAIAHLTSRRYTKLYGIQPHYIILTDGRIQKGRPIDEIRNSESCLFDLTGVEVSIVANQENPPNQQQVNSLNTLLKYAYSTLPGLNIFGENELKDGNTGPGIDVQGLREKFGKTNSIDNPEQGGVGLDRKKIAYIVPKDVAKGTKSASVISQSLSTDKTLSQFERIDPTTGKEQPVDFEKDIDAINTTLSDLKTGKIDINNEINKAFTQAKGSQGKILGDANIAKLQKGITSSIGQSEGLIKNFKVPDAATSSSLLNKIKFP